ncbi:hypothetical protein OHA25_08690 [Nonomuraea sp. NBC_00507]|uniref:hypothetical protein n=1 Tax=Nonomuraea sp. NBC_00507 TaxID=2976002 RepID=UPI002E188056
MTKITVAFEIDTIRLHETADSYLATLWHIAQANPADSMDKDAGQLTERIGREIIRRWLKATPPELWHHQGHHYYWNELRQLGKWVDGVFVPHQAAALGTELQEPPGGEGR